MVWNFLDLLLIAAIGFFGFSVIMSWVKFARCGERQILLLRHVAGALVGLLDQTCMIIFNFQVEFSWIVALFDYAAYTAWFLLMPNFFKLSKPLASRVVWVLVSAAVNTIFEHVSLLTVFGSLNYPTQPIVWTSVHTVVFYLLMHGCGMLIVALGFKRFELLVTKKN